jgi:Rrf2 family protein
MPGLLKISEAAILALHALIYIASRESETVTNTEIAEYLNASENHLSKVLQRLAKAGLVVSTRGPRGGFSLGRDAASITLREIFELFEGPMLTNSCLLPTPVCGGDCVFGGLLSNLNTHVIDFMTRTTVRDAASSVGKGVTIP